MDYSSYPLNPIVEQITEILVNKTQNRNPSFFRLHTNYFLNLIPSILNVKVHSPITGTIPINMYAVSLSNSGSGKGFSTNVLENRVIGDFREEFTQNTFLKYAQSQLDIEAINRMKVLNISQQEAEDRLYKEFKSYGAYQFAFSEATSPAIKQFRRQILLAKCGALNMIVDEVGFNLEGNKDALVTFLELYDKGMVKNKLTKNTETSTRYLEVKGETPTNVLMFGTPSKLLDGGKTEDLFFELLEAGYARRSFFNIADADNAISELSPEELYQQITQKNHEQELHNIANRLFKLANTALIGSVINVPDDVGIELLRYRIECEKRAKELPEHQSVYAAEIAHRYFKVLKLAGAYAFLEGSFNVTHAHLQQAIRFAEECGESLKRMFEREKPYERLAKYIGALDNKELTQVDLTSNLPYYKGSNAQRNEMMNMAIAWGYSNNILIKKAFRDGIEFFTGESLKETDLSKIICAYSESFADGYLNAELDWHTDFDKLLPASNYNWTNHWTVSGHRAEKEMQQGFNCIVLDVDKGISLDNVRTLLSDYEYIIHTTKRHQVSDENGNCNDRFRIILPTNYKLDLNQDEFKSFMQNIAQWCPFELDEQTFQRSRKWACYEHTTVYKNTGILFDVLPFIPRTSREQEYKKSQVTLQSLTNIERWFANKFNDGNRNNQMIKYGLLLLDNGFSPVEILDKLVQFNDKLSNGLDENEIQQTIMKTITARYNEVN